MQRIESTRIVVSKGQEVGDKGTGYRFGPCRHPGDISHVTRGQYQGYEEPCVLLIPDNATLAESNGGDLLLYGGPWQTKNGLVGRSGLTAQEAIECGIVTVEETPDA